MNFSKLVNNLYVHTATCW